MTPHELNVIAGLALFTAVTWYVAPAVARVALALTWLCIVALSPLLGTLLLVAWLLRGLVADAIIGFAIGEGISLGLRSRSRPRRRSAFRRSLINRMRRRV